MWLWQYTLQHMGVQEIKIKVQMIRDCVVEKCYSKSKEAYSGDIDNEVE